MTNNLATTPEHRAIVVSVQAPSLHENGPHESLRELEHLLGSLAVSVCARLCQHRSEPRSSSVLGSGKLEELRQLLERERSAALGDVLVVFDGNLSPGQARHWARELNVAVIDRTEVILRIFKQRARTHIAQLEIERAQLKYALPRIRDDELIGAKQGGGGGRGAKGHSNIELRKQQLRKRLAELDDELERSSGVRAARSTHHESAPRVALVGYTNAGKSSWMQALTGAPVLIQNALFATLDTTVRPLCPLTTPRIMVADTVGFLRNLPNELLASFQSTLAEALDAQLLVIIVDGSSQQWRSHLETTREVLRRVHADSIPSFVLVNKGDLISERECNEILWELPDAWCVSALNAADVVRVRERLVAAFANSLASAHLFVPFELGGLRSEIWRDARVLDERCDEVGVHLTVLAEVAQLNRWQQRLGKVSSDRQPIDVDGLVGSNANAPVL